MKTAEEFAKEYYQLEKSGIESVRIKSAIAFAERYANHCLLSRPEETKQEGEWISVADEMPEHGDNVLCYSKQYKLIFTAIVHNKNNDGRFQFGTAFYWAGTEVSHWRKLPPPPKKECEHNFIHDLASDSFGCNKCGEPYNKPSTIPPSPSQPEQERKETEGDRIADNVELGISLLKPSPVSHQGTILHGKEGEKSDIMECESCGWKGDEKDCPDFYYDSEGNKWNDPVCPKCDSTDIDYVKPTPEKDGGEERLKMQIDFCIAMGIPQTESGGFWLDSEDKSHSYNLPHLLKDYAEYANSRSKPVVKGEIKWPEALSNSGDSARDKGFMLGYNIAIDKCKKAYQEAQPMKWPSEDRIVEIMKAGEFISREEDGTTSSACLLTRSMYEAVAKRIIKEMKSCLSEQAHSG